MTRRRGWSALLVLTAMAATATGCAEDGGSGTDAASSPDGPTTVTTEVPAGTETAGPAGIVCVNLDPCDVEVAATGALADGDVISVRVDGWRADATTGVSQCEDPDDPDNPDLAPGAGRLPPREVCNVEGLTGPAQTETSDTSGQIVFDYRVRAGQTMVDESVSGRCDAQHDCTLIVFLTFPIGAQDGAPLVRIPLTFA